MSEHDIDCECVECVESDRAFFGAVADRLERDIGPVAIAEPDTKGTHQ